MHILAAKAGEKVVGFVAFHYGFAVSATQKTPYPFVVILILDHLEILSLTRDCMYM